MGKWTQYLRGTVRAEVTGVFPEAALNACAMGAVEFWELESVDACTVRLTLFERQAPELQELCRKCGCEAELLEVKGGSRGRRFLRRRLGLLLSAAAAGLLLLCSTLFIWQIEVAGCETLTEGQVLRALEDCGVSRGSYWPSLSADLVRSRMLTRLPELAWMTVNVNGSRAIVLVSERKEKPEIYLESSASDIIAGKTGIITKMSVLNGKTLVQPGQSVVEGEVLVSGTMDSLSNEPRHVRAQAEVQADTWYELTAVCPLENRVKLRPGSRSSRFALKIGKKRVNLYLAGQNQLDECDKIIYEYNLGIEGLFALPVSLIREELIRWETAAGQAGGEQEMKDRLRAALAEGIDGEIVSESWSVQTAGGLLSVTLRAQCSENIARSAGPPAETVK